MNIRHLGLALVTASLLACSGGNETLGSGSSAAEATPPKGDSVATGQSIAAGATTIVLLRNGAPGNSPICEDGRGQFTLSYASNDYHSDICQFGGESDIQGG